MNYDVLVVGSGPAGLAAAVAARGRDKSVLVVGNPWQESPLARAERIDNYLGLPGVNGRELMEHFSAHAQRVGVEFHTGRVVAVMAWEGFALTAGSEVFQGRTLVLAPGVARLAKYPGEAELLGRGVSYCATCDGNFFRGKEVAVVGGGNTALEDALYLAALCPKVHLIHRRERFTGDAHLVDSVRDVANIRRCMDTRVLEIQGEASVSALRLEGPRGAHILPVSGVFAAVGLIPDNEAFAPPLELDAYGYLQAGCDCRTPLPGVFAAGDTRSKQLRQLVTAAADGATAAFQAGLYLHEMQPV